MKARDNDGVLRLVLEAAPAELVRQLRTPLITEMRRGLFWVKPGTSTGEELLLTWADSLNHMQSSAGRVDDRLQDALAQCLRAVADRIGSEASLFSVDQTLYEQLDERDRQLAECHDELERARHRVEVLEANLLAITEAPANSTDTSREAARRVSGLNQQRQKVLLELRGAVDGFTAEELEHRLAGRGVHANGVRPRLRELHSLGYVEQTDQRRLTDSGRTARVWVVTYEGREASQKFGDDQGVTA